ncbi:unnamed protein product [Cuscuta epithymum]|nr:unnamed protein product [Cuscuta epithymum]
MEEMCFSEEVVQALLEHFVEPFLPSCRTRQPPTPSQHQTVAKQMHAVVLLYNYYHRKQYQESEFLDFTSFCIGKRDLVVLETHIVYSLNKPKAAARLYLMQNTQSNNGDTWPHIKDIIGSLQGPLVKRSSNGWMVTSFVKYFHMLPYMEALSDWISREVSSKGFPNHNSELELLPLTGDQTVVNSCGKLITQVGVNSSPDDIAEESLCDSPKTRSNKLARKNNYREFQTVDFSEQVDGPVCMDVHGSGAVFSQRGIESQNYSSAAEVYCRLKNSLPLKEDHRMTSGNCVTEEDIGESLSKPCDDGCNNDMIFMQGGGSCMESLISQNQHHERLNATSTSGNASSRTILRILYHLRQKLCEQHERVSAEILRCDMDIDAALNELTKDTDNPHLEKEEVQQRTSQPLEEESLSEAIVSVKNHCKKLDELCRQMKWKLPTYQVFPYRDGFAANVMVKEGCHVCQGSVCPNPFEARENAASYMMAKLSEAKLLAT